MVNSMTNKLHHTEKLRTPHLSSKIEGRVSTVVGVTGRASPEASRGAAGAARLADKMPTIRSTKGLSIHIMDSIRIRYGYGYGKYGYGYDTDTHTDTLCALNEPGWAILASWERLASILASICSSSSPSPWICLRKRPTN